MSYTEQVRRYYSSAMAAGLSYTDADQLRRDAQRLHSIAERECNGDLVRVEGGWNCTDHRGHALVEGAVYSVSNINGPGPLHYYRTADRETPARARIEKIAASIGAKVEFQGDPRGWPVTLKLDNGRDLSPPCRG